MIENYYVGTKDERPTITDMIKCMEPALAVNRELMESIVVKLLKEGCVIPSVEDAVKQILYFGITNKIMMTLTKDEILLYKDLHGGLSIIAQLAITKERM